MIAKIQSSAGRASLAAVVVVLVAVASHRAVEAQQPGGPSSPPPGENRTAAGAGGCAAESPLVGCDSISENSTFLFTETATLSGGESSGGGGLDGSDGNATGSAGGGLNSTAQAGNNATCVAEAASSCSDQAGGLCSEACESALAGPCGESGFNASGWDAGGLCSLDGISAEQCLANFTSACMPSTDDLNQTTSLELLLMVVDGVKPGGTSEMCHLPECLEVLGTDCGQSLMGANATSELLHQCQSNICLDSYMSQCSGGSSMLDNVTWVPSMPEDLLAVAGSPVWSLCSPGCQQAMLGNSCLSLPAAYQPMSDSELQLALTCSNTSGLAECTAALQANCSVPEVIVEVEQPLQPPMLCREQCLQASLDGCGAALDQATNGSLFQGQLQASCSAHRQSSCLSALYSECNGTSPQEAVCSPGCLELLNSSYCSGAFADGADGVDTQVLVEECALRACRSVLEEECPEVSALGALGLPEGAAEDMTAFCGGECLSSLAHCGNLSQAQVMALRHVPCPHSLGESCAMAVEATCSLPKGGANASTVQGLYSQLLLEPGMCFPGCQQLLGDFSACSVGNQAEEEAHWLQATQFNEGMSQLAQSAMDGCASGPLEFSAVSTGYATGCTVFMDVNGNGYLDPSEPSGISSEVGQGAVPLEGQPAGPLVLDGTGSSCLDAFTALAPPLPLRSPAGCGVLSTLSTLAWTMTGPLGGLSASEASEHLASAFGTGPFTAPGTVCPSDPVSASGPGAEDFMLSELLTQSLVVSASAALSATREAVPGHSLAVLLGLATYLKLLAARGPAAGERRRLRMLAGNSSLRRLRQEDGIPLVQLWSAAEVAAVMDTAAVLDGTGALLQALPETIAAEVAVRIASGLAVIKAANSASGPGGAASAAAVFQAAALGSLPGLGQSAVAAGSNWEAVLTSGLEPLQLMNLQSDLALVDPNRWPLGQPPPSPAATPSPTGPVQPYASPTDGSAVADLPWFWPVVLGLATLLIGLMVYGAVVVFSARRPCCGVCGRRRARQYSLEDAAGDLGGSATSVTALSHRLDGQRQHQRGPSGLRGQRRHRGGAEAMGDPTHADTPSNSARRGESQWDSRRSSERFEALPTGRETMDSERGPSLDSSSLDSRDFEELYLELTTRHHL